MFKTSSILVLICALVFAGCGGSKHHSSSGLPPASTLTFSTTSVPTVVNGSAYSTNFSVGGNVGAVTFSLTSGSMPQGLSLSSSGAVSGVPTIVAGAQFTVRVRATDTVTSVEKDFTFKAAKTVAISTTTLTSGTRNSAYSGTLFAVGGTQPYTWSVVSGTTPPGLTVATTGLISGTPTTAGTFLFTVKVVDTTDAEGQVTDQKQVTLVIQ